MEMKSLNLALAEKNIFSCIREEKTQGSGVGIVAKQSL